MEEFLKNWYLNDDIPEKSCYYNAKLEESLILRCSDIQSEVSINILNKSGNIVYLRIAMSNDRKVHLLLMIEKSENVWTNIIEKYDIATDIVIDSHKGMGGWFENVPLYRVMKNTKKRSLLPQLYFKGKYISHDALEGFEKVYEIRKAKPNWCTNEIYNIKW